MGELVFLEDIDMGEDVSLENIDVGELAFLENIDMGEAVFWRTLTLLTFSATTHILSYRKSCSALHPLPTFILICFLWGGWGGISPHGPSNCK